MVLCGYTCCLISILSLKAVITLCCYSFQSPAKSSAQSVEREIKPRAANAVEAHKEKFQSKRNVFEEAMQRGGSSDYHSHIGGGMFDESFRVEETKTMETDYIDSGRPSRPVVPDRPLVNE